MPKGKTKNRKVPATRLPTIAELSKRTYVPEFIDTVDRIVVYQEGKIMAHENKIKALDEAICPRVAARLTALERSRDFLVKRADDQGTNQMRVIQDIDANTKSIGMLHGAYNRLMEAEISRKDAQVPKPVYPGDVQETGSGTTGPRVRSDSEVLDIATRAHVVLYPDIPWRTLPQAVRTEIVKGMHVIVKIVDNS